MIARTFSHMMMQGKIQSTLRQLSQNTSGEVLSLDDLVQNKDSTGEVQMCSTRDMLTDKHPPANPPDYEILLPNDPEPVKPIAFQQPECRYNPPSSITHARGASLSGLDRCTCLEPSMLLFQICILQSVPSASCSWLAQMHYRCPLRRLECLCGWSPNPLGSVSRREWGWRGSKTDHNKGCAENRWTRH